MINILTRHKEETEYAECFNVLEKELACMIASVAGGKFVLILKDTIRQRLAKIAPEINNSTFIYSYKSNLKEIFEVDHPLQAVMTREVMDIFKENAHTIKGLDRLITCIDLLSVRHYLRSKKADKDPFELVFDHKPFLNTLCNSDEKGRKASKRRVFLAFGETSRYLIKNIPCTDILDVYTTYLNEIKQSNKRAISIGRRSASDNYESRIHKALNETLSFARIFQQHYMYSVVSNIAEMNKSKLREFNEGLLSDIPYIENIDTPSLVIEIATDDVTDFYIKTKKGLTHLKSCDYDFPPYPTYDFYPINSGEKIKIYGQEYDIDTACFEGENLAVFEMAMYGNSNYKIHTNLVYNYENLRDIAMSFFDDGIDNPAIYDYLTSRLGLYNKNKRKSK